MHFCEIDDIEEESMLMLDDQVDRVGHATYMSPLIKERVFGKVRLYRSWASTNVFDMCKRRLYPLKCV